MTLNALRSLALAAATVLVALPAAADISFTFTNATERTIMYLYVSPSSSDEWGDDILGADILEAGGGGQVTIREDAGCEYDIRAVFVDGEELEDSVNICEMSEYTFTEE